MGVGRRSGVYLIVELERRGIKLRVEFDLRNRDARSRLPSRRKWFCQDARRRAAASTAADVANSQTASTAALVNDNHDHKYHDLRPTTPALAERESDLSTRQAKQSLF